MQKISREESTKFFGEVLPVLSGLLLRLPSMLETHYQKADSVLDGIRSGLRLLGPQEAGIVFLSQVNSTSPTKNMCLAALYQNWYTKLLVFSRDEVAWSLHSSFIHLFFFFSPLGIFAVFCRSWLQLFLHVPSFVCSLKSTDAQSIFKKSTLINYFRMWLRSYPYKLQLYSP